MNNNLLVWMLVDRYPILLNIHIVSLPEWYTLNNWKRSILVLINNHWLIRSINSATLTIGKFAVHKFSTTSM